jgi:hypothetical protein
MNPWRKLARVASWVMRLALVFVIYTRFFGFLMQFRIETLNFYISAGFIILGFLLLAGGFLKQSVTVVASLGIVLLSIIQMVMGYGGISPSLAQWMLIASAGMYFLTHGNK